MSQNQPKSIKTRCAGSHAITSYTSKKNDIIPKHKHLTTLWAQSHINKLNSLNNDSLELLMEGNLSNLRVTEPCFPSAGTWPPQKLHSLTQNYFSLTITSASLSSTKEDANILLKYLTETSAVATWLTSFRSSSFHSIWRVDHSESFEGAFTCSSSTSDDRLRVSYQRLPGKQSVNEQPFILILNPKISSKPFKHAAAMPNHFLRASRKLHTTVRTLEIYYFFLENHINPVLSKQKVAGGWPGC